MLAHGMLVQGAGHLSCRRATEGQEGVATAGMTTVAVEVLQCAPQLD